MNFKKLYIIIFIISIIGLAIVQYQFLRIGLNLAKVQFNQKIGLAVHDIKEELKFSNELTFLVGKALTKDDSYFKLSLDSMQDASRYFMNDYLNDKLLQHGIKTDFTYVLYTKDSTAYLKFPQAIKNEDNLLKYTLQLNGYLPELVGKRLVLELKFNNLTKYFLFQLNGLTIPSLVFIIAIIFIIIWELKSLYLQRKLITTTNEFINNLTHELKTPVFSIGVASKILQDRVKDDEKEFVKIIRNQIDKLKKQIDKVLELATIENKKSIVKKSVIDFKPVILKIATEFEQLEKTENINFIAQIEGDKYILNCEPSHLENAISSLLENARKYSKKNAKIILHVYKDKGKLVLKIKDNGIGISEDHKSKIFDKFFRVTSGDVHNVKGYGLGLHYVKRIVKLHKGNIKVESSLGQGSEFIITLPLNKNGRQKKNIIGRRRRIFGIFTNRIPED